VVCFLLEERCILLPLLAELDDLVRQHAPQCAVHERAEWSLVWKELDRFRTLDRPLLNQGSLPPLTLEQPCRRLRPERLRRQTAILQQSGKLPELPLSLKEAVLVGSRSSQPKMSELTMDVFRMLFTVEWEVEWKDKAAHKDGSGSGALVNPHKYMLHRTTTAQLLLVLATALVELPPGSALLVYLSADGLHAPTTTPAPSSNPDGGGGGSKSGGAGDSSSSLAAPLPSSTGRSSPAASLSKGDTSSVSDASPPARPQASLPAAAPPRASWFSPST